MFKGSFKQKRKEGRISNVQWSVYLDCILKLPNKTEQTLDAIGFLKNISLLKQKRKYL